MTVKYKKKEINLKESPITYVVGQYKFYFSSLDYQDKFKELYQEEIERFNKALTKVYKNFYDLNFPDLAIIRFYNLVEKVGFYIEIDGVGVDCLEKIQFKSGVRIVS